MCEVMELLELLEYQGLEATNASKVGGSQVKKGNGSGDRLKAGAGEANSSAHRF